MAVCLLVHCDFASSLACDCVRFPVVVLYCKRKPAGLRRIAEALRTVTRRVTGGGLQVDYKSRASLGRRHDKLVLKHGTGSFKSGVRRSSKGIKRKKQSPPRRWNNLQKSGTQFIPRRAVFGQGRGLGDPCVQSWGLHKGRL